MIYNHNIITKEQKQAFVERKESRNKIFFYGIIVALLTFSLHFPDAQRIIHRSAAADDAKLLFHTLPVYCHGLYLIHGLHDSLL